MAAPQDYPRDPDNTFTSRTWAEVGVVNVPSSGRQGTGWLPLDTVTEGEVNYLGREPARWNRASQASHLRSSNALNGSWLYRGKTSPVVEAFGTWSETGVINPREVFLSDGTGVPSRSVDVWIDPDANGAIGLQVKVSLASPLLLLAISDSYIFIDTSEAIAGLGGGMTVVAVPNAAAAPATPAGTVLVWILETDALTLTGQTLVLPTVPVFKTIGVENMGIGGNVTIDGDLDVDGQLEAKGPVILGDDITDTLDVQADATFRRILITNVPPGTVGLNITGAGDQTAQTINGGASGALSIQNAAVAATFVAAQTGTGRAGLFSNNDPGNCTVKLEQLGAGCALEAASTGAAAAILATCSGTGAAVAAENTGGGPAGAFVASAAVPTVSVTNSGTGPGGEFTNNDATTPTATFTNNGAGPAMNLPSGDMTLDAGVGIVGTATSPITGGQITSLATMESANGFQGIAGAVPDLPQGANVPTAKTLALSGTASIALTNTAKVTAVTGTIIESGRFEFIAGAPAPDPRQMAMGTNGILGINTGSGLEQNHQSTSGWVYATGDQEAETGLAVAIFTATTTEALLALGVGGNVRVIVYGQGQRSVAGAVTIDVQEDQGTGTWTDIGAGQAIEWVDTASATIWSLFRHERVFAAGTLVAKSYRLHITSSGGPTAKVREVRLKVVNERA